MTMAAARARNRRDEPQFSMTGLLGSTAALALAHPRLLAGTAALAAVFSFFAGNALYYQSQQHPRVLFSTRSLAFDPSRAAPADPLMTTATRKPETRVVFEREASAPAQARPAAGDPTVQKVQKTLGQLGLYDGSVDGLTGPRTTEAVRRYQEIVGLPQTGEIDTALLDELTQTPAIVSAIPTPRPPHGVPEPAAAKPDDKPAATAEPQPVKVAPVTAGSGEAVRIARIQAGLRAFGHDQIEIDGIAGAQTRQAIEEFQSLFRLMATGQPDARTEAKMREIGLIN